MRTAISVGLGLALAACGTDRLDGATPAPLPTPNVGSGSPPDAARTEPIAVAADAPAALELRPLGVATAAALGFTTGPGHGAYRRAEAAAEAGRWDEALVEARAARTADASHLAAAWLEARALGHLGRVVEVLAPLEVAATGDWPRFGEPSLIAPELAAFRAAAVGRAWVDVGPRYRARWAQGLGTALVMIVGGDLAALDASGRWLSLSRRGDVVAQLRLPDGPRVAFVTGPALAVGTLDLNTGAMSSTTPLPPGRSILRWRSAGGDPWLEMMNRPGNWQVIDAVTGALTAAPTRGAVLGPRLVVADGRARVSRLPILGIAADWDDDGLASAIRITRGSRTLAAPPGLFVDGDTVVSAPGGTRVAFAAVPTGRCAVEAALAPSLIVAEIATGRLHRVAAWTPGAEVAWLDERTLAIFDGGALTLAPIEGKPTPIRDAPPLAFHGRAPAPCPAAAPAPGAPTDPS